jgi:hypothetical protein
MARYEHLPIYRDAYDLCLYFEKTVRNMSRYDKYTLGTDLRNLSREILRLIMRANSEEERCVTLREVRSKVEELKVVLRLARESGAIVRTTCYEFAAGKAVAIGKQNEGWLSAQSARGRPESRTAKTGRE